MPPLTRWYIKLALGYFLAALTALVWQAAGGPPWLAPVSIHLFVVGWITGMIFGVAYWMFPKYSKDSPRGPDRIALATFGLLHTGLWLRVVGEATNAGMLLVVAALFQWLAGTGFIVSTWPRVKER
ncbi:MAG TPA: hypothetical protein VFP39_02040 [Gemmatimonadales bacterium]|nr:hypothetical protein [Gemmatimonadales bacterium]